MKGVAKITVTQGIALVTFTNAPCSLCSTAKVFRCFADAGINMDMISQSAPFDSTISLSFTVDEQDLPRVLEVMHLFYKAHRSFRPMISGGNCKINLHGEEMLTTPGIAADALEAVAQVTDEVMLVNTSPTDISLLVPQTHAADVAEALRKEFCL